MQSQRVRGNIYIYIYIYEVGGVDTNWETVSFRSCVRTRGLVADWNVASHAWAGFRLFPFIMGAFPFFLLRV
jgi:hypothetical protein